MNVSNNVAIRVESLGKKYRIGSKAESYKTLRDTLARIGKIPSRAMKRVRARDGHIHSASYETFWALKDVSLEVERGEVVGIIGRNGAGKSTLLKILTRITDPTEGYAEIRGRVGSLLEVGTGFHAELTGRENVFLNGAILGMKRLEIERKFDEIVDFAEVEKFIDTPVKHYSSGMYLRLAFAVAAHLETEILLVDEVLAVGDAPFQKKCLGKMEDVSEQGRTVVLVSHNMGAISQLCSKAIVLEAGRLAYSGDSSPAIEFYLKSGSEMGVSSVVDTSTLMQRAGTGEGRILKVELEDLNGNKTTTFGIGEPFLVRIYAQVNTRFASAVVGLEVKSSMGVPVVNLRNDSQSVNLGPYEAGREIVFTIKIPGLPLYPGLYRLGPWFAPWASKRADHLPDALAINLECRGRYQSELFIQEGRGILVLDCDWNGDVIADATRK
jgi:lipopolysaccharide transport system ATP-binding protein